jgi:hypothetical protein
VLDVQQTSFAAVYSTEQIICGLEYTIMKIYYYYSVYTVRTKDFKSYCEFVDITHSRVRWLSLFPAME